MADIQSCYFCGTGPDVPLESYGVVPSAFEPSPDEQRSVVLCPSCQNKLTALLRPVVLAAGGTETASTGDSGADLVETSSDVQRVEQRPDSQPNSPASQSDGSDDTAASASQSPGSGLADTSNPPRPAKRTISFDDSDGDDDTDGPPETGGSTDPTDGSGLASADQRRATESEPDETSETSPTNRSNQSGDSLIGNNNDAYRKVIRLLQNRDFPVRRDEIEELAMNAYQLGPQECSGAIDTIVQKGLLVEEEGMLLRPGN